MISGFSAEIVRFMKPGGGHAEYITLYVAVKGEYYAAEYDAVP